jgi:hypothetical protein
MDLAITSAGAPGLTLWRNVNGTSFERVDLPSPLADGYGVAAIDYDNDGWVDLAAVGGGADAGVLQVLRNVQGHFEDVSASVGATKLALKNPRALLAGDRRSRQRCRSRRHPGNGAPPVILRNDGGNANHAVRVALTGLADNRSGVGTKVEVQAGATWQKFETVSASGFLGQSSPEILAGIGQATEADVVRLLWPTGVVQDEVQLAADKRHAITEIDRRGSSCRSSSRGTARSSSSSPTRSARRSSATGSRPDSTRRRTPTSS